MTSGLLSSFWIKVLSQYDKLVVGFSGGLDSTVLLHLLVHHPDTQAKLHAVHVNHQTSSHALSWQLHCQKLCDRWRIPLEIAQVTIDSKANFEEKARMARYAAFTPLIALNDCLVLGHHSDDQAETVLLQLCRGAGVNGLAAMSALRDFSQGHLARPLLSYSRAQLITYAQHHNLSWVEDDSNQKIDYSRNFIRHKIIPLLATRWPNVVKNMARAAEHCQEASCNLDALALQDNPLLAKAAHALDISLLTNLEPWRIKNVLNSWFKKNTLHPLPSTKVRAAIIEELINARADAAPIVTWKSIEIRRYQHYLYLYHSQQQKVFAPMLWLDFPNPLTLVEGLTVDARLSTNQGLMIPANARIKVAQRQGGELFYWHGQHKELKKLFQQWHMPPWLRAVWPLVYINDVLACVPGYAISDVFYSFKKNNGWDIFLRNKEATL